MHPVLFQVGGLAVPTYGVAMAAGFLVGIKLALRGARIQGVSANRLVDMAFWVLLTSIAGSRLLFVLTNPGDYVAVCLQGLEPDRGVGQLLVDCTRALQFWDGGHVFYGGVLAAIATIVWFTRRHGMQLARVTDLLAPSLALGHFFGRMGCYAAGCCHGKATTSALGVSFPAGSLAHAELTILGQLPAGAAATPPLHPTQLYEALVELCIFGLLLLLNQRRRWFGQTTLAYLVLYPAARFVIELFRGDHDRRYLLELHTPGLNALLGLPRDAAALLSTSQLISLLVLGAALTLWLVRRARARAAVRA